MYGAAKPKLFEMMFPVKKDYPLQVFDIKNHKGYQNQIIGSKVTAIFFNGQKFLNGGVVSKGSVRSLQGRLVVVYSIQTGFSRKMAQIFVGPIMCLFSVF